MDEEKNIDNRVKDLYDYMMDKPKQVLDIFNDFFGEDKVDIQGYCSLEDFGHIIKQSNYSFEELVREHKDFIKNLFNNDLFILVHFPHVRVINEHDRGVDISHLWAKVKIRLDGTLIGKFTLNRSEYQFSHFVSGYMHSHVSHIPKEDFTEFQTPCTGDGPINDTMNSLHGKFDRNLWQLFCLELSKYVTVESVEGRPYKYLEKIGSREETQVLIYSFRVCNSSRHWTTLGKDKLREFVKYFIQENHLKFSYKNGSYSIGMTLIEYIILISNEFIKWYNEQFNKRKIKYSFEELKNIGIIKECIIRDNKIYNLSIIKNNLNSITSFIGQKICTFKGTDITLSITDMPESNENETIIFNPHNSLFILNQILKVLNYRYGRKTATHTECQIGTEVRYL